MKHISLKRFEIWPIKRKGEKGFGKKCILQFIETEDNLIETEDNLFEIEDNVSFLFLLTYFLMVW